MIMVICPSRLLAASLPILKGGCGALAGAAIKWSKTSEINSTFAASCMLFKEPLNLHVESSI